MRIAVVQHRLRSSAEEDVAALAAAAIDALRLGAELLVLPELPTLSERRSRDSLDAALGPAAGDAAVLVPEAGHDCTGRIWTVDEPPQLARLGRVSVAVGDAVMDPAAIERVARERPAALITSPRSESELQAEAVLELALGLSLSVAGLVLIAETSGAEPGRPGHGGSAVVLLGEVVAEATSDDDVLIADIDVPVPAPEPREPVPLVPPILLQRLAHHRGERPPLDYPAELS